MGGAIFNDGGSVSVLNTTFSGNRARGGSGSSPASSGAGLGGALFNYAGSLVLDYVTITASSVADGYGSAAPLPSDGAAIYTLGDGLAAAGGNDAAVVPAAFTSITRSVIAGNAGGSADFYADAINGGTAGSGGAAGILARNAAGAHGFAGSAIAGDPALGPLADNGGPAWTHLPGAGSPALDQAACDAVASDQRGVARPQNGACDLGAVERQALAALAAVAGTPQSATVGTAFAVPLQVRATDAQGVPIAGVPIAFECPAAGASCVTDGAAAATTDRDGLAALGVRANTVAGDYAASARAAELAEAATFALSNRAGATATLTVLAGDAQSAVVGTRFAQALAVRVADAYGNAVAGRTVQFACPQDGPGCAADDALAVTDADGRAQTGVTANIVAGGYAVQAGADGLLAAFALMNRPGAPATLQASGGAAQSATVGTPFAAPLVATVSDAFGNPVEGANVTFACPDDGASCTLSATTAATDAAGHAQATATANTHAGAYAAVATLPGLDAASFALTNLAGPAATLAIAGGDAQDAVVGSAFAEPLQAIVADAYGNPLAGAVVRFACPASGASCTGAADATSDADGRVAATLQANTVAGAYAVSAHALQGDAAASFALANRPDQPVALALIGGSPQSADANARFAEPLAAVVFDRYQNAVPGVAVTFFAPGSGASAALDASVVASDGNGVASTGATANGVAGRYRVLAALCGDAEERIQCDGFDRSPLPFELTNR
jgi:hypothetical protein